MGIDELYKTKGQLVTSLEVIQAKLQQVNAEIVKLLNEQNQIEKDVKQT